jgi:hypothetical protein
VAILTIGGNCWLKVSGRLKKTVACFFLGFFFLLILQALALATLMNWFDPTPFFSILKFITFAFFMTGTIYFSMMIREILDRKDPFSSSKKP